MLNKWQFWVVGAALAFLGLAIFGYRQSVPSTERAQGPQPQIIVEPASYNFGELIFGVIAETKFKIKNAGPGVLQISRLTTSCSCTTASVGKNQLNPGEETELVVRYDTSAMGSGSHGTGQQDRIIYVKSNDPVRPQVELTTTAFVK
ncbi:MAG: DUF1573 domain-containing protein [Patescibacteria group bacterium]